MSIGKRKRIYSDKVKIQIFGVMRTYFIRTSKTAGEAPLYVRAQKRTPKINMMINTGIMVDIAKWNKAFCTIELYARGTGKQIEKLVKMIDTSLDDAIAKENCTEQDIRDKVRPQYSSRRWTRGSPCPRRSSAHCDASGQSGASYCV